jgi:hypothetical protein
MQSATLHIKVKPELANGLKELSQKRKVSVGELVRQAVFARYQLDLSISLNNKQRRALEAYQGGYISLSRLAADMGMSVWDMRHWLNEHDLAQNNDFQQDDVTNA